MNPTFIKINFAVSSLLTRIFFANSKIALGVLWKFHSLCINILIAIFTANGDTKFQEFWSFEYKNNSSAKSTDFPSSLSKRLSTLENTEAANGELEISDTPNQQDENEDDQTHTYSQRIDDLQNILVDAEWNPLIPQPKRWKLHQINLRIKKEAPSSDIVNYESTLARIFRK